LAAIAIESGRSFENPDGTSILRSSCLVARSTTEMFVPPEFATYIVLPSGVISNPFGPDPTRIGASSDFA